MIEIKVCVEGRSYTQDIVFIANDYEEVAEIVIMLKKYGKNVSKIEIVDSVVSETEEEE